MDAEERLLHKVYAPAEAPVALSEAVEHGITVDHFTDPELARVWALSVRCVEEFGALPSVADIAFSCDTNWKPGPEPEDSLGRLIELAHQARRYAIGLDTIKPFKDLLPNDPDAAWALMRERSEQAAEVSLTLKPTSVHEDWETWFNEYWEDTGLQGISTGFPTIDYATGGLQKEQLVTIIGTPKAGKSTLLLKIAHHINRTFFKRVYFVTFEMTAHEQRARLACMEAHVDYARFLQKTLTPKEEHAVRSSLRRMQGSTPDFFMATDISAGTTVSALLAQARKFDPDVIFVDGVYLMDSGVPDVHGMDPRALTALTRGLKRMAQQLHKPVVISHQALESRYSKTKGLRSADVGYSSSFAQDSDVMLGIEHPGDDDVPERRLSIMLARNAAKRSTLIDWDWTTSTFEEIDGYEETGDMDSDEAPDEDDE